MEGASIFMLKAAVWDEGIPVEDDSASEMSLDDVPDFNWIKFDIPVRRFFYKTSLEIIPRIFCL